MAVAASRPQPPAVLREELAAARARGVDWELAWRHAVACSLRGVGRDERGSWIGAYMWSELYWRNAYIGVAWDHCDRPIYPT